MAGNNWRGLPKTGGAGEMLWMAYAPGGVKGLTNLSTYLSVRTLLVLFRANVDENTCSCIDTSSPGLRLAM